MYRPNYTLLWDLRDLNLKAHFHKYTSDVDRCCSMAVVSHAACMILSKCRLSGGLGEERVSVGVFRGGFTLCERHGRGTAKEKGNES